MLHLYIVHVGYEEFSGSNKSPGEANKSPSQSSGSSNSSESNKSPSCSSNKCKKSPSESSKHSSGLIKSQISDNSPGESSSGMKALKCNPLALL